MSYWSTTELLKYEREVSRGWLDGMSDSADAVHRPTQESITELRQVILNVQKERNELLDGNTEDCLIKILGYNSMLIFLLERLQGLEIEFFQKQQRGSEQN